MTNWRETRKEQERDLHQAEAEDRVLKEQVEEEGARSTEETAHKEVALNVDMNKQL